MNTNAPHADLFKRFLREIQLWCHTGKLPQSGNQDMKYYLDLQKKRLKRHNLKIKISFEPEGQVLSSRQVLSSAPILNAVDDIARFRQSTYFQSGNQTITYYRDDEEIYSRTKFLSLYETILDPEPGCHHIGAMPYACPNCGAISQLSTLQEEGCPYCGTRYIMKDLYPKVTNYYALDTGGISQGQQKKDKTVVFSGALIIGLLITLYSFFTSEDVTLLLSLVTFLGSCVMGAFLSYLGLSLFYMGKLFVSAGKSMKVVCGSRGTKRKITEELSQYDPSFSYEYFEGKALSLARMILFHDDLKSCVQYKGKDISGSFADWIDMQYRGGFGVQSITRNQDHIEVVLTLYLTSTVDDGKKITEKDETLKIWMYHHGEFPVDPAYSIKMVKCPCCGGSFDAGKTKECPYCNQEYDAGIHDWVVTKIER